MLFNNLLAKFKKSKKQEYQMKKDELKSNISDKSSAVDNTKPDHKNIKGGKINSLILKTLVGTEKADKALANNRYVFYVYKTANKTEIKKEIKKLYGVMPIAVNILNVLGKTVSRGRTFGKKIDRKKVYVTLKKGDTIKI